MEENPVSSRTWVSKGDTRGSDDNGAMAWKIGRLKKGNTCPSTIPPLCGVSHIFGGPCMKLGFGALGIIQRHKVLALKSITSIYAVPAVARFDTKSVGRWCWAFINGTNNAAAARATR